MHTYDIDEKLCYLPSHFFDLSLWYSNIFILTHFLKFSEENSYNMCCCLNPLYLCAFLSFQYCLKIFFISLLDIEGIEAKADMYILAIF